MHATIGLVALGLSATSELPTHLLLDVGLVRVAPNRPGGSQPWDQVTVEKSRRDPCDVAEIFPGAGKALAALCDLGESGGVKVEKHPLSEPDVFVRIIAGPGVSYRSHTVTNTLSHVFHFRAVVPTEAIPASGLEVYVQNDDGQGDADTQENIGALRISRAQLATALRGNGLLRLNDREGGLDGIEIAVSGAEPARSFTKVLDVSGGSSLVDSAQIAAGEVIEVLAKGQYRVGGTLTTSTGRSGTTGNMAGAPLDSAPHGVAWLAVGRHRMLQRFAVPSCATIVAPVTGQAVVGINAMSTNGNSGDLTFKVSVRPPTVNEWRSAKADGPCTPVHEYVAGEEPGVAKPFDADEAKTYFQEVAKRIQQITHPSGNSPALTNLAMKQEGEMAAIRIDTTWRGGLIGALHSTRVLWEFNERRHIRAIVEADNSPTRVAEPNKQQLDAYFAKSVYPVFSARLQATIRVRADATSPSGIGQSDVCRRLAACTDALVPGSGASMEASYGREGACWKSQEAASACAKACEQALDGLKANSSFATQSACATAAQVAPPSSPNQR